MIFILYRMLYEFLLTQVYAPYHNNREENTEFVELQQYIIIRI